MSTTVTEQGAPAADHEDQVHVLTRREQANAKVDSIKAKVTGRDVIGMRFVNLRFIVNIAVTIAVTIALVLYFITYVETDGLEFEVFTVTVGIAMLASIGMFILGRWLSDAKWAVAAQAAGVSLFVFAVGGSMWVGNAMTQMMVYIPVAMFALWLVWRRLVLEAKKTEYQHPAIEKVFAIWTDRIQTAEAQRDIFAADALRTASQVEQMDDALRDLASSRQRLELENSTLKGLLANQKTRNGELEAAVSEARAEVAEAKAETAKAEAKVAAFHSHKASEQARDSVRAAAAYATNTSSEPVAEEDVVLEGELLDEGPAEQQPHTGLLAGRFGQ